MASGQYGLFRTQTWSLRTEHRHESGSPPSVGAVSPPPRLLHANEKSHAANQRVMHLRSGLAAPGSDILMRL